MSFLLGLALAAHAAAGNEACQTLVSRVPGTIQELEAQMVPSLDDELALLAQSSDEETVRATAAEMAMGAETVSDLHDGHPMRGNRMIELKTGRWRRPPARLQD